LGNILVNSIVLADSMPPITPTYGRTLPFFPTLLEWAGDIQGAALIISGILFVGGVVTWIAGRLATSSAAQKVGGISLVCGVVGAALIGAAFALTQWGANQPIVPGS